MALPFLENINEGELNHGLSASGQQVLVSILFSVTTRCPADSLGNLLGAAVTNQQNVTLSCVLA